MQLSSGLLYYNAPLHPTDDSCCGTRHLRRLSKAVLICRPFVVPDILLGANTFVDYRPRHTLRLHCICHRQRAGSWPRPLAQVAPPASGGAPIAPQLLSYIFLLFCGAHLLAPLLRGLARRTPRLGECPVDYRDTPSVICFANATSLKEGGKAMPLQLFYKLRCYSYTKRAHCKVCNALFCKIV